MSKIKQIRATSKWSSPLVPIPGLNFPPVRRPRGNKCVSLPTEAADYLIHKGWAEEVGVVNTAIGYAALKDTPSDRETPASLAVNAQSTKPQVQPAEPQVQPTEPEVQPTEPQVQPTEPEEDNNENLQVWEFFQTSSVEEITQIKGIGEYTAKQLKEKGDSLSWSDVREILGDRKIAATLTYLGG